MLPFLCCEDFSAVELAAVSWAMAVKRFVWQGPNFFDSSKHVKTIIYTAHTVYILYV